MVALAADAASVSMFMLPTASFMRSSILASESLKSVSSWARLSAVVHMIASFADGSTDSVNAVAGMASATDEELAAMVSRAAP